MTTDRVWQAHNARRAAEAAEADLDPLPEALQRLLDQLGKTVEGLRANNYPSHDRQQEITIDGEKELAWVRWLRSPKSEIVTSGKNTPYAVGLLVKDDGSGDPRSRLVESHAEGGEFTPFDPSGGVWIVHINGVVGFLQEIAGEPKRKPWDD